MFSPRLRIIFVTYVPVGCCRGRLCLFWRNIKYLLEDTISRGDTIRDPASLILNILRLSKTDGYRRSYFDTFIRGLQMGNFKTFFCLFISRTKCTIKAVYITSYECLILLLVAQCVCVLLCVFYVIGSCCQRGRLHVSAYKPHYISIKYCIGTLKLSRVSGQTRKTENMVSALVFVLQNMCAQWRFFLLSSSRHYIYLSPLCKSVFVLFYWILQVLIHIPKLPHGTHAIACKTCTFN